MKVEKEIGDNDATLTSIRALYAHQWNASLDFSQRIAVRKLGSWCHCPVREPQADVPATHSWILILRAPRVSTFTSDAS